MSQGVKEAIQMDLIDICRRVRARLSPTESEFRRIWPAVNGIEGLLVSPDQERWLFKAGRQLPDLADIVEIGSFKGRSTSCLAYGIKGTRKHVFAIDTFEGNEKDFASRDSYYEIFLGNLKRNGLSSYVTPLRGVSSEVGKTWNKPIHLLFSDGGHEYEDVLADCQTFYPYVVPGGLVAFHDVHNFKSDHGPIGFLGVLKMWQDIATPLLSDHHACATLAVGRKRAS
jgi:hypothetical protein